MSDWWTTAAGPDLEQGEVLFDFPVIHARTTDAEAGQPQVEAEIASVDVVVVTQTCDLESATKADVLVARVVAWEAFAAAQFAAGNTAVKSSGYIENLIRGTIPPLTLLSERDKRPRLAWSVVDFRELYAIGRRHFDTHISQPGSKQRLRLLSPYKEHLSQAFARYFMRVGLPHDAAAFRSAGKEAVSSLGRAG